MKKTLLLILLLLVVGGAVMYFSRRDKAQTDLAENYEGNFAVQQMDAIGKIVLTHRAGPTYTLTRTGDKWMINDTYPARMSSVQALLDAVHEVQIRYIPGRKATPNVVENIEGTYIHAQIFDRSGNLLKSYRVGGVSPDERGTYMMMDGSTQPFVVHISHWDGALRTRYALSQTDWRDRRFMNLNADDITGVTVDYPRQKSHSFILERSGNSFDVQPLYPDLRQYPASYRKGTAEVFLNDIAQAACEGFEELYPGKDSIRSIQPFCELQIRLANTTTPVLVKIWPKGLPVYTEFSPPVHRLFIERIPGDFVLAQFDVIKGMMRGYDFFHTGVDMELIF